MMTRSFEMPPSAIRVNDTDIAYDLTGEGEPLMLIHGLGGSRLDWSRQIPEFSQRYRVLVWDVRGHGDSGKPRERYTIARLAEDAAAIIRELQLGPMHVVGLSMGGMIGLQLAVDEPELVRSLTVVNSAPEVIPRGVKQRFALWLRVALTRLLGPGGVGKLVSKRLFPKPEQEPLRQALAQRLASNDKRAYLSATRAIIGWSVADRIHEIECPVLVVSGDRDYTPVEFKADYAKQMPTAELAVIADSGHATPLDQPADFNAETLAFLTRASAHAMARA